jgi:hypothetical protein
MDTTPSTHGTNGKDQNGRFAAGNRLGRGNPLAGRAAKIRAVLLKHLTPKDAGTIADTLIRQAKEGDLASIRELLDRTIGRPAQTELLERVEAIEKLMEERGKVDTVKPEEDGSCTCQGD